MIVFDLACTRGHAFEGWFASGDEFERQKAAQLVRCPLCDDHGVERKPSARVRVTKHSPAKTDDTKAAVSGVPAEVLTSLREMVRNTEDVGERFPEEARRIHYEEAAKRSIRGRASKEEAESLKEEGIEFASLPTFLTEEGH
jgi:hypothetical protein